MKYIQNKKDLQNFLDYESKIYDRKNSRYPIFAIKEKDILWKFIYLLRKTEYYTNTNKKILRLLCIIKLSKIKAKYALNIPVNVFDKGLKLIHIGPRVVNGKAKVGKNCSMHVNTCIVAGGIDKGEFPILEDNVVMGIGSVVLGNAIVKENTAIGANAVVNKKFTEGNITIAGVPAKKISNHSKKDWNKKGKEGK